MYANSTWLVFFNSLVEVSARVPHITCLTQVTLEWIDHILSVYDCVLPFFRTKLGSWWTQVQCEDRSSCLAGLGGPWHRHKIFDLVIWKVVAFFKQKYTENQQTKGFYFIFKAM